MTVENQTNKTAPQVMGTSFDYDFTFKVLTEDPTEAAAKEGIKVSVSNDTETVDLEYGTDYTVTLNGNGVGGTVTVTDKRTSDWSLIIYREYDLTQGSDYNNYNAFPAETLERNLDKLTMITQQLSEESSRSVKVGMFSDADPSEIVNEIEVVYENKDDVIAVAQSITDVNAVASDLTNVDIVATNISDVNTVAGDIANVNTVAGDKTNIDTVAGVSADVSAVAGDLTNIDAVASDLTNVDAVSAALTNVGTVAGSIANVNAVGTDISNVNAVSADLTNIDMAAGNIADINTAAANIAAIIDAPNQASAAAASATLAEDWASKTDGPVEGAEYSAKWYALNTDASGKADKDLSNLTNGLTNTICTTTPTTTSTASSATPAVVVENYRNGDDGYVKFSDGFILQYGQKATATSGQIAVTFLTPFTHNVSVQFSRVSSFSSTGVATYWGNLIQNLTLAGFTFYHDPSNETEIRWMACGY